MLTQLSDILQRLAIGWEQVDFEKTDVQYRDQFTKTRNYIKTVSQI